MNLATFHIGAASRHRFHRAIDGIFFLVFHTSVSTMIMASFSHLQVLLMMYLILIAPVIEESSFVAVVAAVAEESK